MTKTISSAFNYDSHFIDILGSKIHYIDVGEGEPILFIHGNPTSSYLWRNIIPHLQTSGRCIAIDLIGMGKSDKPDISYDFFDHYRYLEGFIESLGLKNVTLIVHDWGSGLGFHYAANNESNVKAIAFMEAIFKTWEWHELRPDMRKAFKMLRFPVIGWLMVSVGNGFIKKLLPDAIMRKLTMEEMSYYAAPYPTIASRRPLRRWPIEVPLGGKPKEVCDSIDSYSEWLKQTNLPLLCLYAHPGLLIDKRGVGWIAKNMPGVKMVDVGRGIHYIQEDEPEAIGKAISGWYDDIQ